MFEYDKNYCNIKNCPFESHTLLLCEKHFNEYITDTKSKKLQDLIYRKSISLISYKEKLQFLLRWYIHHTFNFRIYLVEHFPLETLFLYHYKSRRRKLYKLFSQKRDLPEEIFIAKKTELLENLRSLCQDFDYEQNAHLPTIKHTISSIEGTIPEENYFLHDEIKINIPYNHQSFIKNLSYVSVLSIVLIISSNYFEFAIKTLFSFNIFYVLTFALVGFGWAYFGVKYLYAIDPVTKNAISNDLYENEQANNFFLTIVFRIKANLIRRYEALLGIKGIIFSSFVVMAIQSIWGANLTLWESLVSIAYNLLIFSLFYTLAILYPVFSNASSLIWRMPKKDFKISVYNTDKKLGLTTIYNLLNSYFIFNIAYLAIIWIVLPIFLPIKEMSNLSLVLYFLAIIAIGTLRISSIRKCWQIYKNIRNEVLSTINSELEKIRDMDVPQRLTQFEFVKNLKFNPVKLEKIFKIALFFFSTIVIPVSIIIIDKNSDFFSEVLISFLELLVPSK